MCNDPSSHEPKNWRKKMLRGTLVLGIGALLSRTLGLLRDVATAAAFGMSAGGIMDAFVAAFRLPDVARRFFGDGSLGVSFIPVFAQVWHDDRKKAWTLLSVTLFWVFVYLFGFVLAGELLCWIGIRYFHPEGRVFLTAHLVSLLLPYLILICMAAICSAALQALGRFTISTLVPPILNVIWLLGLLVIIPLYTKEPEKQCYLLTICILIAGIIQFAIHLPSLRKHGFRFHLNFSAVAPEVKKIFENFFPKIFGLTSIHLNVLTATCIAWFFSGGVEQPMRWLGGMFMYPLRPGSAAAIYYSERMYEFPQGLIGLAIAMAIYPLLSRHAAQKDFKALSDDLTLGLRIQFMLAVPAGCGLMLLADSLVHLFFQRGAFSAADTIRTGDMVFWFATGIWAFCALPIIVRAFYTLGDIRTPCQQGLLGLLLNIVLGLWLIFPMQEQGLALAMSLTAAIQSILLVYIFTQKHGHIDFPELATSLSRICIASGIMTIVLRMIIRSIPGGGSLSDLLRIALCTVVGAFVFFVVHRSLGGRELGILFRGGNRSLKSGDRKKE
jgi:putative peptidoglycan lipid II flippase